MNKVYKSPTILSLNLRIVDGDCTKHRHISFEAITGGGSQYLSRFEAEQLALETHSYFGKLFKLDSVLEDEVKASDTAETTASTASDNPTNVIAVTDYEMAKQYLAETHGVSRTALRSHKAIREQAEKLGIVFEGLDEEQSE